jgi:hypothetical protein
MFKMSGLPCCSGFMGANRLMALDAATLPLLQGAPSDSQQL